MREISGEIYSEIRAMTFEELKTYIEKLLFENKSSTHNPNISATATRLR